MTQFIMIFSCACVQRVRVESIKWETRRVSTRHCFLCKTRKQLEMKRKLKSVCENCMHTHSRLWSWKSRVSRETCGKRKKKWKMKEKFVFIFNFSFLCFIMPTIYARRGMKDITFLLSVRFRVAPNEREFLNFTWKYHNKKKNWRVVYFFFVSQSYDKSEVGSAYFTSAKNTIIWMFINSWFSLIFIGHTPLDSPSNCRNNKKAVQRSSKLDKSSIIALIHFKLAWRFIYLFCPLIRVCFHYSSCISHSKFSFRNRSPKFSEHSQFLALKYVQFKQNVSLNEWIK